VDVTAAELYAYLSINYHGKHFIVDPLAQCDHVDPWVSENKWHAINFDT
jgi:hypothetical protein